MTEGFRFSSRPNRAHEIEWREWGRAAFDDAVRRDRPILLNLTAVWCHWCHRMDETTYSEPDLIALINEQVTAVRVDADRYPHVQDRYIAGGWPTNAFLTPTGEVLWAGTYVSAEQFRSVATSVLTAWAERRTELKAEIELRRKAMEAARSRRPAVGIVRREAGDDVLSLIQESYDARNGGFGEAPKFPQPEVVLLLFGHGTRTGNDTWVGMAEQTLSGMLAGDLWDAVDGGFFRYTLEADWSAPHHEKLLDTQAGLLRAYSVGAALLDRADLARRAEETVAWVQAHLLRPDGFWGASQEADASYYELDAADRRARIAPPIDPVLYLDRNASWIQGLAEAGGRLGHPEWVRIAHEALPDLLAALTVDGVLHHFRVGDGAPQLPRLLTDCVAAARACLAVAQASGDNGMVGTAAGLVADAEAHLWAEQGGFYDHARGDADVGALRYRERPFELNVQVARVLLDLVYATGDRRWRGLAERTLAVLSPLAGRYGSAAAEFAAAVDEFYDAPLRIFVVGEGERAAALRAAALRGRAPERRVWSLPEGGRIGSLTFPPAPDGAAYVCGPSSCSPPIPEPERLSGAISSHR